ncbi:WAP four-disulfide core domain protein 2-like isoform X1 [Acanthaster planci]|uniref:WAP four-disulfide core domain protein 2-like isoform X1 n=1 Tax=Acanthaster planci TaxID=133434 RepID=A0A8B7YAG7_ACAPL|nr:WAP four-disulfide core domain protein 2-like isoform X1 [Acanthaster planci]
MPEMELGIFFCSILVLFGVQADWKPGLCPAVRSDRAGTCKHVCTTDFDCHGNQKCCKNVCGTACQRPVIVGELEEDAPYRYLQTVGPSDPQRKTTLPHEELCPQPVEDNSAPLCVDPPPCKIDQDCAIFEKCCFTGCSFMCVAPKGFTACYHNGKIYQTGEDYLASDGCNTCYCSNGFFSCTEKYCDFDPAIDKTRILTLSLIALGVVCLVGCVLSLAKHQLAKRTSSSVKNVNKKTAVNMTHELEFLDPLPTKV